MDKKGKRNKQKETERFGGVRGRKRRRSGGWERGGMGRRGRARSRWGSKLLEEESSGRVT